MTKTPLPFPASAFESTGNNPLAWRHSAENLLMGARAVRNEVRDFGGMMHSLAAVEALLLGFAIECLLKAIYVKGGNKLARQGKYVHVRNAADHDLMQLANAAGMSLTTKERRAVTKLTPFILFAGRYPIAREANSMQPAKGKSPRFILRAELEAADQLCERLMSAAIPWTD